MSLVTLCCVDLVVVHSMVYLMNEQPRRSLDNVLRGMVRVGVLVPEGKHWLRFLTWHCLKLSRKRRGGQMGIVK